MDKTKETKDTKKDLKLFMNLRRMRHIKRCNNFPTLMPEDVAQHSYYTTLLARFLSEEYNKYAAEYNSAFHPFDVENQMPVLDIAEVTEKALLHDCEEAFTSDIPWNVKHASKEFNEAMKQVVADKMETIFEGSTTLTSVKDINSIAKKGFPGQVVDFADMLELAIFCCEEYTLGNNYLKSLLYKCLDVLVHHPIYAVMLEASPLFKQVWKMLQDSLVSPKSASKLMEIY